MRTSLPATALIAIATGCTSPEDPADVTDVVTSEATSTTSNTLHGIPYTPRIPVAACTAEAVLAAMIAEAGPGTPRPPLFMGFWEETGVCEPPSYSAALETSYVRCGYEVVSTRPSAIRHYVGTAFYFCGPNRYRFIEGAITQHVTPTTDLVMLASGGWYEDGSSYDNWDCYAAIKSDDRSVSGGLVQCFRDRAKIHRTGNALVIASSAPEYGSVGYRLAIFEEDRVTIAP